MKAPCLGLAAKARAQWARHTDRTSEIERYNHANTTLRYRGALAADRYQEWFRGKGER